MQFDDEAKKAQVHRLRRIEGQVRGLQRLIERQRLCRRAHPGVGHYRAWSRSRSNSSSSICETCVREASENGVDPQEKVSEITAAIARLVRSWSEQLKVQGMTCGHCAHAVTEELRALEGVTSVSVDLVPDGVSTVTGRPQDRWTRTRCARPSSEASDYHLV